MPQAAACASLCWSTGTPGGEERLGDAEKAIGAAEDEVLRALSDRRREQLFELLPQASAGRAPDCAAAAAEREPEC
jgi:hypothetical protein